MIFELSILFNIMKQSLLKLIVIALFACTIYSQSLPACRNHKGEAVDWFLIYYAPRTIR